MIGHEKELCAPAAGQVTDDHRGEADENEGQGDRGVVRYCEFFLHFSLQ